jgi:NADH-quinone oxidoreductase subunit A
MTDLVTCVVVFTAVGIGFVFTNLLVGRLIRPDKPDAEKGSIYECGEPTIGSAWIQFDLRFYVVALLFVIFDVEMAFLFPWALVFGTANRMADTTQPAEVRQAAADTLTPGGAPADFAPELGQQLAWIAFADLLVFFGVLLVGFVYLWRRGDLDWVRSTTGQEIKLPAELAQTRA